MRFTFQKKTIIDVLAKIQGLTGRKSNLTITENVLIKAADKTLTLSATDLETGFEGLYPAEVEENGICALNARKFFEIVREFPSEEILVNEIENRWLEIGNPKVQYHIVGMNPEDFPDSPYIDEIPFFKLPSDHFRRMIERSVMISGTGDDKRAHIKGVYFQRFNDNARPTVRLVSTDGSRLSLVERACNAGEAADDSANILIPKKGLNEVAKFLDDEGEVLIGIKGSYFVVKKTHEIIIIRLLEGEFPQYDEIINKADSHEIRIDRSFFTKMLKRMSILSSENYKGAIFKFTEEQLVITATNPDIGESKEDMAIEFDGPTIEAAFNPKFFIDALNAIEDQHVLVCIQNEEKPCIIEGETDKSYLSVIMPMRI
jgi:DNA polymerase-3 subunit beta